MIPLPEDHPSRTSDTLLGRLRQEPKDQSAWNDFVARYQPQLLKWCRGWGLKEPDAHDARSAPRPRKSLPAPRATCPPTSSRRRAERTAPVASGGSVVHRKDPVGSAIADRSLACDRLKRRGWVTSWLSVSAGDRMHPYGIASSSGPERGKRFPEAPARACSVPARRPARSLLCPRCW
jgi:hypothetical protein